MMYFLKNLTPQTMSKLNEVIKELSSIITDSTLCYRCDNCGEEIELFSPEQSDLKEMVDALRELNKPVQYVVNYKIVTRPSGWVKLSWVVLLLVPHSRLNDLRFNSIGEMKDAILTELNHAHRLVNLPPITIEQITFVEI